MMSKGSTAKKYRKWSPKSWANVRTVGQNFKVSVSSFSNDVNTNSCTDLIYGSAIILEQVGQISSCGKLPFWLTNLIDHSYELLCILSAPGTAKLSDIKVWGMEFVLLHAYGAHSLDKLDLNPDFPQSILHAQRPFIPNDLVALS